MATGSGRRFLKLSFLAGAGFFSGLVLYFLFLLVQPGPARLDQPARAVRQISPGLENILVYSPAEAIFIFSLDQTNSRLKVTSLDPAAEVQLAEGKRTLAELYDQAGIGLVLDTLNEQLGLDLQKFILVDKQSLAAFIDAAGGLELEVTEKELAALNSCLAGQGGLKLEEAGLQLLDGVQASCWAMAAPGRQQDLFEKLLAKTAGWQLPLYLQLAGSGQLSFQSNFSLADPARLGLKGLALDKQVLFHEIRPKEPDRKQAGKSFVVDWAEQKQELGRFLEQAGQGD